MSSAIYKCPQCGSSLRGAALVTVKLGLRPGGPDFEVNCPECGCLIRKPDFPAVMSPGSPSSTSMANRFETATTILIALVSTVIALVAAQIAVVMDNSNEAQNNGVLAKINLDREDGASRIRLAGYRRNYDRYRFNNRHVELLRADLATATDGAYKNQLRQQIMTLEQENDNLWRFTHFGYVTSGADGQSYFDGDTYIEDMRQGATLTQDIVSADDFAEAERSRRLAINMTASMIVLFVAVMFLTWAQVTQSALRWLWLGLGILTTLLVGGAYALAALLGRLGG